MHLRIGACARSSVDIAKHSQHCDKDTGGKGVVVVVVIEVLDGETTVDCGGVYLCHHIAYVTFALAVVDAVV